MSLNFFLSVMAGLVDLEIGPYRARCVPWACSACSSGAHALSAGFRTVRAAFPYRQYLHGRDGVYLPHCCPPDMSAPGGCVLGIRFVLDIEQEPPGDAHPAAENSGAQSPGAPVHPLARHLLPDLRGDFNNDMGGFVVLCRIQGQFDVRIAVSRVVGVTVHRLDATYFDVRDIAFDGGATPVVPAGRVISRGHHGFEGHIRIDITGGWHRHAPLERVK